MDTPNPVTGLTGRQVECITSNWDNEILKNWKEYFIELFMRLFVKSSKILESFNAFDDMSFEDIRRSGKLRAHTYNFKSGLNGFVTTLDDPECLVHLINKLTTNHYRRGIKAEEFKLGFQVFMDINREWHNINEETEAAWTAAIAVIGRVMAVCVKELAEEKDTAKEQDHSGEQVQGQINDQSKANTETQENQSQELGEDQAQIKGQSNTHNETQQMQTEGLGKMKGEANRHAETKREKIEDI